ncbi:MAG: hypothetical protein ABR924_21675 [Terracidiphilus sp.]
MAEATCTHDKPCTQSDPMDFDELKRRIDHLHRMMLPENAAPGCFTYVEMLAREMNALTARWQGKR